MKTTLIPDLIFQLCSPKEVIVIFDYANYATTKLSFIRINQEKIVEDNLELKLAEFPLLPKSKIDGLTENTVIEKNCSIISLYFKGTLLNGLIYIVEPQHKLAFCNTGIERLLFNNYCLQFTAYVCALADTNQLQIAYDALEKKYIHREKNAILGDIVPEFIHDINTPLGNINLSSSEMSLYIKNIKMELDTSKVSKTKLLSYINGTEELNNITLLNVKNCSCLINDVRNVYKGQIFIETITVNLKQHLEEILFSLKPLLKGHKQQIALDCPEDITISCKASVFFEIINNFLTNSIKYGFPDNAEGDIKIAVQKKDNNLITIMYQDNGKGLDEKIKDTAFDRFVTSSVQKGTGLGMYIIKQIVNKDLKGQIIVDSAPDQGVKFTITFPITNSLAL